MQLSEQEVVRREKLTKLREMGINPYPANLYPLNTDSEKIKQEFEEGKQVVIAGRLMSRRIQGKASFAELQDSEGRIQFANKNILKISGMQMADVKDIKIAFCSASLCSKQR